MASCQCIAIGWSYGGMKFYDNINEMMGYVPVGGKFMPFAWIWSAPGISITTLIVYFIQFPKLSYTFDSKHPWAEDSEYFFPRWTQYWGLTMSAIPGLLIAGNIAYFYLIRKDRNYDSYKHSNDFSGASSPPEYSEKV